MNDIVVGLTQDKSHKTNVNTYMFVQLGKMYRS